MSASATVVSRISLTPVKGTALSEVSSVVLGPNGVAHNRLFHFVDASGKLVNGKQCGQLVAVHSAYDGDVLTLAFPDGSVVSEVPVRTQEHIETGFYGRPVAGTVVGGPFATAVSHFVGQDLRLVQVDEPGSGLDVHPVTLISAATLTQLRSEAGAPAARWAERFRMLFELDGLAPYEEESWAGRTLCLGESVLTVERLVPRCVITKQDPRDGRNDFNTLGALQTSRGGVLLGMYATVRSTGAVRLGDSVSLEA